MNANQDADDLRCWKECIEYDSQCDTDMGSSLRRTMLAQYGWQQMIKDKECSAITTCADQRTVQYDPRPLSHAAVAISNGLKSAVSSRVVHSIADFIMCLPQ